MLRHCAIQIFADSRGMTWECRVVFQVLEGGECAPVGTTLSSPCVYPSHLVPSQSCLLLTAGSLPQYRFLCHSDPNLQPMDHPKLTFICNSRGVPASRREGLWEQRLPLVAPPTLLCSQGSLDSRLDPLRKVARGKKELTAEEEEKAEESQGDLAVAGICRRRTEMPAMEMAAGGCHLLPRPGGSAGPPRDTGCRERCKPRLETTLRSLTPFGAAPPPGPRPPRAVTVAGPLPGPLTLARRCLPGQAPRAAAAAAAAATILR